jgi:alkane 1-monooxygenase
LRKIGAETLGAQGIAWVGDSRDPTVYGLCTALGATLATLAHFGAMAGWVGAITYVSVIVLVAFSIQLVTYMQHWGLGDDVRDDAHARAWGWEHDCRLQAWVTLNLSLHHAHHLDPHRPYYRTTLAAGSPRLPAGYVLLMFAACLPRCGGTS